MNAPPAPSAPVTLHPLPDAATPERVAALLADAFPVRVEARGGTRTLFDSFDRRLLRRRELLGHAPDADGPALRWETVDGELVRRLPVRRAPAFVVELPPGPFRDALDGVVDVRRLLPLARGRYEGDRWAVRGGAGKIVARVAVERWSPPRRAGRGAQRWLRVSAVRGYEKRAARVREHLARGLQAPSAPFEPALGWLGVVAPWLEVPPGDDPVLLDPAMRADDAFKRVLLRQVEVMRRNEDGMREALDPEFLHDYRVAVRRTRAALSKARDVLPAPRIESAKRAFRWLGSVTSPRRDLDVHVLNGPRYEAALPPASRPHLAPLEAHLEDRQAAAQRPLVRALGSARYRRLLAGWEAFLRQPGAARTRLRFAARPAMDVANRLIARQHRRLLERGLAIDDATAAEGLHRVRLEGKKLRYLLEFFRSLYDPRAIRKHVRALKGLQDCLGDFNDYEVQQAALQDAAREMVADDEAPPETLVAVGQLVESLAARQQRERDRFHEVFTAFASKANRARARDLFGPRAEPRP